MARNTRRLSRCCTVSRTAVGCSSWVTLTGAGEPVIPGGGGAPADAGRALRLACIGGQNRSTKGSAVRTGGYALDSMAPVVWVFCALHARPVHLRGIAMDLSHRR